jgi:hypothetical protein
MALRILPLKGEKGVFESSGLMAVGALLLGW